MSSKQANELLVCGEHVDGGAVIAKVRDYQVVDWQFTIVDHGDPKCQGIVADEDGNVVAVIQ